MEGLGIRANAQAAHFLELARQDMGSQAEGHIRASIVFSLMAFEAFFLQVIRGFIHANGAKVRSDNVKQVERGLEGRAFISAAVKDWPILLTGKPLDCGAEIFAHWVNFTNYRNALVHGDITRKIPNLNKLAQDVETIDQAQLAHETAAAIIRATATHFGFEIPAWASASDG